MSAVTRQFPMHEPRGPFTSRRVGGAASVLLHGVLVALVLSHFPWPSRGSPLPTRSHAMQISISTAPSQAVAPSVVSTAAVTPPKPIEPPPMQTRIPLPAPKPAPVRPTPAKPQSAQPAVAVGSPKPAGEAAKSPRASAPPPVETPEQSLLGSIHDNWLEPAMFPRGFRCRIRIDYLAGGRIRDVAFVDRCGDSELVESVRKAVWKTQPLPLPASKTAAGNIVIEFTP